MHAYVTIQKKNEKGCRGIIATPLIAIHLFFDVALVANEIKDSC